jgi:hypothetical protein
MLCSPQLKFPCLNIRCEVLNLSVVREWVRYQTEYGVKVNPLTAVSESVLRKIRHTQNIDDAKIRDASSKQFPDYLAKDLEMDNSFMFFNELQDALSYK